MLAAPGAVTGTSLLYTSQSVMRLTIVQGAKSQVMVITVDDLDSGVGVSDLGEARSIRTARMFPPVDAKSAPINF